LAYLVTFPIGHVLPGREMGYDCSCIIDYSLGLASFFSRSDLHGRGMMIRRVSLLCFHFSSPMDTMCAGIDNDGERLAFC